MIPLEGHKTPMGKPVELSQRIWDLSVNFYPALALKADYLWDFIKEPYLQVQ